MRVALNAHFWEQPHTGSGRYARLLVPALRALDPTLAIDLLAGPLAPRLGGRGENVRKLLWEQAGAPLLAHGRRADLLHVPYWAPPLASATPVVVTVHDVIPALLPEYRGSRLVQAYTRLVRATTRRAARVLVDSECSKRDLVRLTSIPAERVDVVPLAADPRYRPLDAATAQQKCRDRWRLAGPFLLYIGGNDVRKNVPTLLRAWADAAPALPDHTLVLAGSHRAEPPFFPDLPALARELGLPRVRFLGRVSDNEQQALLSACTAFVWPSRYEGFGLPPLEAMQCGAPVLSSAASSLPEVVGDAGLLFDPDDGAALSRLLVQVASDDALRARLRAAGLAQAGRFTWERTAALTLAAYRRAVGA